MVSYCIVILLVVFTTAASSFKTSNVLVPNDGWYQIQDNELAPLVMGSNPALDRQPAFDDRVFEALPTTYNNITCGPVNARLCAVYFQASTSENILSPVECIYCITGGRP